MKYLNYILIIILLLSNVKADCLSMYSSYYNYQENFDLIDYVFGDDNCCDEFPVPLCGDDRIYFEKEDYADYTDSDNWDVISPNVAITRANSRGLYNAVVETEYQSGSPVGTVWSYSMYFGATPSTSIAPTPPYVNWTTWAYINTSNQPFVRSMYSIEDDAYYDFLVTRWTQGDGDGGATWPGSQDGNGAGNGGGFSYYRSGPIDYSANIINITDVPNDQGGRVYINFKRSMVDVNSHPHGLDMYTVQRLGGPNNWVNIGSMGATGEQTYTYEATTLADSSVHGDGLIAFRVIAQSFYPDLVEVSTSAVGYSVDNISPSVPQGLSLQWVSGNIELYWDSPLDNDFHYFILERSSVESFESFEPYHTIENYYLDQNVYDNQIYYYRLRSVDYNGNMSDYTELLSSNMMSTDNSYLPNTFSLHQNYPNPFNPKTQIRYDIKNDVNVRIDIYDLNGNMIKTLINENQSVGYKSIYWDATNDYGQKVSTGVYIYTIQADNYFRSRKMLFLK